MTRHGGLSTALVHASVWLAFLAAGVRLNAADYFDDELGTVSAGPGGNVRMTPGNAPRAGSISRSSSVPAYQRATFDPPPTRPAEQAPRKNLRRSTPQPAPSKSQRAAQYDDAMEPEYFDPRADRRPTSGRRTSINRAAYEQVPTPEGTIIEGTPTMPMASPEEIPMPGQMESMPGIEQIPNGPLRYRRGATHYGAGPMQGDCGCEGGAVGGGNGGACGDGCNTCDTCSDWYPGKDLTLFSGVHGFKGPTDNGRNGNFGFQEGVNWSSPFWNAAGIGFQLGVEATQSDFHNSAFFSNDRSQFFITTGFFRRQTCERGWQWGIVYDHLFDEFDEDFDVAQVRGELSYLFRGHELGFWFTAGARDDHPGADSTSGVTSFETVDMYSFFYRRRLMNGGEGRLWGGFTGESDVIFGGDLRVPLACDWDIVAAFNYLAPQNENVGDEQFREAWNIGINLVWYVCPEGALKAGQSRYRPLFNVADNGTLVVNTVR